MKAISAFAAAALLALGAGQAASASPAAPSAAASATARVEIVNFAFRPRALEVSKGTKVVFSNTSSRAHTATRDGGFDTRRIKPGRTASVQFQQRGTFRYHCKIHPEMRGRIIVG